jgi:Transposase family tnp2.
MKRKYITMPIIIQGPKQPGNDIDVYLRPLVEDLKLLWKKEGVPVWDEDKQEEFNLRALLFVTINDWPALSNLYPDSPTRGTRLALIVWMKQKVRILSTVGRLYTWVIVDSLQQTTRYGRKASTLNIRPTTVRSLNIAAGKQCLLWLKILK